MFAVNSRARLVHITLIVMFLFGAAVPTTALAKPSVIQNDLANSSDDDANALQTSTVLLACDPGSYTFPAFAPVCSGTSPGTSLTEEFDVVGRIPYLGGGDVKFKIQCDGVDCVPRDIYYAASMDVTFSDPWGTPHDWDASLTNEIHFTTTISEGENIKCGINVASGECHLEISGVIPAEIISENSDDWINHYFTIHAYVSSPLSWVDYDIHTVVQVSLNPIVDPPTGDCPGVTLSPIAQAVQAEVGSQNYCGNRYDGLITLPPGEEAFERFADVAETAIGPGPHEIDFVTMGWDSDRDPAADDDSPGDKFLRGIKSLYDDVQEYPEKYQPYGVRVRILLGLEHYAATLCLDQRKYVMDDLDDLGIIPNDLFSVEVATYRDANHDGCNVDQLFSGKHSHVKMIIVDGKSAIVSGYNLHYNYFGDHPEHDMGVHVSGPIAQNALQVFDSLWTGAHLCNQFFAFSCIDETIISGAIEHDISINPTITGTDIVFSLFRDDINKSADDAIAAAIEAADSNVNIIQNRFMNSIYPNPYEGDDYAGYARATLNALQKGNGQVQVNILVSGGGVIGLDRDINIAGICSLRDWAVSEDPIGWPDHRLTAKLSSEDNPIHTKALSIDETFIIVGSQNFDQSAWGEDLDFYNGFGDLAEYSLGIQSSEATNDFNSLFDEEFDSINGAHEILCPYNIVSQPSLQSVIDQASPGAAIFIPAGVYSETTVVNKPVILVGEGANQSIIRPQGNEPAFRITSSNVVISNMKISGGDGYGIEIIDSSPSSLKNIQINRVVFENNAQGGILAQGLIAGSPMDYAIEDNTFIGGADGVTINMVETQAETSVIRNNIFSGQSNAPVHILSTDDSRVEYSYNLFDDCGAGNCNTNWLSGNISAVSNAHDNLFDLDPLFASPENGAYQLSAGSPAIDAGDPELLHDLFFDGDDDGFIRIDIGAFEYVPVENVSPVVDAGNDQTVTLGNSVTVNATYTDADNTESHSARIDWGDGTIEDVPVNMTSPGTGEINAQHAYSGTGGYVVEVCVTDLYGAVECDSILVTVNSGFPSTGILDNFNRANGSIGSDWSGNTSGYVIASNQLSVDYSGSNSDIYWSNEPFGADQEAYVTLTDVDGNAWEHDLLLKAQSNNTWGDGVLEVLYDPAGQRVQVWTYEWPTGWLQHGADIPVTFVDGDQFGARALADGAVEVYRNGELLAARDISSWSHYADGGYIGLWFIGAESAVLDDFSGGTVSIGMQSMSMGGTIESQSAETSLTPEQLNVILIEANLFWQGAPIGSNQKASVTFTQINRNLNAALKPQSNGVWGEGIVEVVYDVSGGRIQVWMYDAQKGWMQIGKDVPAKFTAGDTFTIHISADNTLEISRNGKVIAKRTLP